MCQCFLFLNHFVKDKFYAENEKLFKLVFEENYFY